MCGRQAAVPSRADIGRVTRSAKGKERATGEVMTKERASSFLAGEPYLSLDPVRARSNPSEPFAKLWKKKELQEYMKSCDWFAPFLQFLHDSFISEKLSELEAQYHHRLLFSTVEIMKTAKETYLKNPYWYPLSMQCYLLRTYDGCKNSMQETVRYASIRRTMGDKLPYAVHVLERGM
jgi:hypothetical protein